MPQAYFEMEIKFKEIGSGQAEIVAPQILVDKEWRYVWVNEGEQKAIVQVEGADQELQAIEADPACRSLTDKRLSARKAAYPQPRLKQKYRPVEAGVSGSGEGGEQTLETFQTVRWKFYLIDVPILAEQHD